MADKKDFLSQLAQEADDKRHGKKASIDSVSNFVSRHQVADNNLEEDENEYPNTEPAVQKEEPVQQPVQKPQPAKAAPVRQAVDEVDEDEEGGAEVEGNQEELYGDPSTPDAFQDEKREKIEKQPIHFSKGVIIGGAAALALIGFLVWFFLIRASITVPNFVGKTLDDVSSWAKQNQMSSSAIATTSPEYSMDYDSGVVVKQSLSEGTMVKKDTPISITLSQGPNPDDSVDFPDIKSMTQSELNDWVSQNKLLKTKITTQYSTTVANGDVISYELKNTAESDFTRGSTLNIVCSKGAAPAGQVTVENYVGKTYSELQTWANNKKIMLNKQTEFSTTVDAERIISQSVASGQTMNEGDTLTVVVSKGKGVTIPNLVGYTDTQLKAWQAGAGSTVTVIAKTVYSSSLVGTVLAQDIPAGSQVEAGSVLSITTSLYLPIMEKTSNEWLGKDFMELKTWVDEANGNGANIQAGEYGDYQYSECSDTYKTPGMIIAYACMYGTSDEISNGCTRPLTTSSRIAYKVSTGACTVASSDVAITNYNIISLTSAKSWCDSNHVSCVITADSTIGNKVSVKVQYTNKDANPSVTTKNSTETFQDLVKAGTTVTVWYNPNYTEPPSTPTGN